MYRLLLSRCAIDPFFIAYFILWIIIGNNYNVLYDQTEINRPMKDLDVKYFPNSNFDMQIFMPVY